MITDADKQLTNCLKEKISSFRKDQPYVWMLRLTEKDFTCLHQHLEASIASHDGSNLHLLTEEYAVESIVYLAEWYKRKYKGSSEKPLLDWSSKELKQLWEASGVNIDTFVYQSIDGKKLWQYSIFVLGGLAIRHELGRVDNRFLKQMCRLYYGEAGDFERFADDDNRAIAFRQSIAEGHSLHHFLQSILTDQETFAEEDTNNPSSDVAFFIQRLKTANDEVLREKFRLEWIFSYARSNSYLIRRLRLLLRPEDIGGTHHPYLRLERLRNWGFTRLEETFRLQVGIRFLLDDKTIQEADFVRPLLTFINTGETESGFVAWNTSRIATLITVPFQPFNHVQVIMKSDLGEEIIVYKESVPDVMQFYRISIDDELWSSLPNRQKHTAVWYSDNWRLDTLYADSDRKVIHTRDGDSHPWNWTFITNEVTLIHQNGESKTFYNRIGCIQIQAKLHSNTFQYEDGGLVRYVSEQKDDSTIEHLPLIYGKNDLIVFNPIFVGEDFTSYDKPTIERIEFKGLNNRYQEWTEENSPSYGLVFLRVFIQGEPKLLRVVYTPEITRCFETHSIKYGSKTIQDECTPQITPLNPTITIQIGNSNEYAEIDVYRPTLLKEICMNDKVISAIESPRVLIPYCLKDLLTVHDFNVNGYTCYQCCNLPNIYNQINLQITDSALQAWEEGKAYQVNLIDPYAPESLWMVWGYSNNTTKTGNWFSWNYHEDTEPQPCCEDTKPEPCSIVFQSMRDYNGLQPCLPPKRGKFMPFKYKKNSISVVKVFQIAALHKTYFFPFYPLQKVTNFVEELYNPLLTQLGGKLDKTTISDLKRLAEEFGFRWEDFNINLDY